MKHMWKIAKWEIMRNLTNKQFIIGLLLTPLIMALFAVVPVFLERWNRPSTSTYYVIDELGAAGQLQTLLPENIVLAEPTETGLAAVEKEVRETKASGYFVLNRELYNI